MNNLTVYLTSNTPEEIILLNKPKIMTFFNMNSVFWFFNNEKYREIISKESNVLFPDGRILSLKLRTYQQRGPGFTKRFLISNSSIKEKKHFFIGLDDYDAKVLSKKTGINTKKIGFYNPPFIRGIEFQNPERKKILKIIKKFKPDFIWVCLGGPKQDILSNFLYEKYRGFYFNIGAGMDFLLSRKKESPGFFRIFGIEWLYRLLTDFNTTKKKAWRSFIAIKYLKNVELK